MWLVVQAGHPPYAIPPATAADAEAVFEEMLQAGHMPDTLAYNWLIQTQVNAGCAPVDPFAAVHVHLVSSWI